MQAPNKTRVIIIWGTLCVLLLGVGAFAVWKVWLDKPAPPAPRMSGAALAVPNPASPLKPLNKEEKKQPATASLASSPPAGTAGMAGMTAAPAAGSTGSGGTASAGNVAGNLGAITHLRSQKEELELQVKIKELHEKLTTTPVAPAVAQRQADVALLLEKPLPARTAIAPPSSRGPVVVAVQGMGGALSAVIRTGSSMTTVRKGSRFGGGVVTDISRAGVMFNRGGKLSALPFE